MKNKLRSLLALAVVAIAVFMFTMAVYGTGKFDVRNGTLVKYSGGGGAVKIPDNVTIIGEEAFAECRKITLSLIHIFGVWQWLQYSHS